MKQIALILTLFSLVACDEQSTSTATPDPTPPSEIPTEEETKEEIKEGVKDVLKERPPKWKIEYSGDYSGTIQGGIMSVVSVSSTTSVAGGAMTKDKKGKAPEAFRTTIFDAGKGKDGTTNAQTSITLADGTRCTQTQQDAAKQTVAKVYEADRKIFHATLKGELQCGDAKDKKIKYSAVLKKKP